VQAYEELAEAAVRETIAELEAAGSPVITDGEQGKPSFATYPLRQVAGSGASTVLLGGTRSRERCAIPPGHLRSRARTV
jgi:5-methyltetrahydropteroyltriglutamate--homocysteine methyltransferase